MIERPAGAPGEANPALAVPHLPRISFADIQFLENGEILLPGGEVITLVPSLYRSTPRLEIVEHNGWGYCTDRADGTAKTARWVPPYWLLIPHTPAIPALAPPAEKPKRFDRDAYKLDYAFVDFTLRNHAPLHTWSINKDGNIDTDDGRRFPAGHPFDVTLADGTRICRKLSGHIAAVYTDGRPPEVYFQRDVYDRVHHVFLVPTTEPTIFDKVRTDPLRHKIAFVTALFSLFALFVCWVEGEPVLAPVFPIAALFMWWLYYHPTANEPEEDFFAQ
jgi:hypothetical protein